MFIYIWNKLDVIDSFDIIIILMRCFLLIGAFSERNQKQSWQFCTVPPSPRRPCRQLVTSHMLPRGTFPSYRVPFDRKRGAIGHEGFAANPTRRPGNTAANYSQLVTLNIYFMF